MKKLLCTCLIIFFHQAFNCQKLSCEKIQNLSGISFAGYFSINPNFLFKGDTLFTFKAFKVSIALENAVKTFDLSKQLPKKEKQLISEVHDFSYCFSGDQLIIRNKNNIFLFHYTTKKFTFQKSISLVHKYGTNIFKKDNQLYFFNIYNYHPKSENLASGFLKLDLTTGAEEVHELPFGYLAITHLTPQNYLTFTNTGYLVCDPLRYKLYEYDFNNTLKDSIGVPDSLFKTCDVTHFANAFKVEELGSNVSSYLPKMTSYLDSLDRVWIVSYIDENTLFVRLTRNTIKSKEMQGQLFYDHIWVKKNGKWTLTQTKEISSFRTEQTMTEKDLWPYFFPGSKLICSKGILYYTVWSASKNIFPQNANSFFGFDIKDRNALSLKLIQFKVK